MDSQDAENQNALFSIANEIKKFHLQQNTRKNDRKYFNPIFENLRWYKTSIKAKKKLLAHLKKKLSIACIFAKILLTNKSINTYEIRQINTLNRTKTNGILDLNINNDFASSKLIDTTYKQLWSNQDKNQDVPEIDKLKEIICLLNTTITKLTQEKSKVENLERKNQFLTTKLMLTENHLQNLINQNHVFKKENFKLAKRNEFQKNRIHSELYPSNNVENTLNSVLFDEKHKIKLHITNMKLLVNEQTKILKELRSMSEEF